MTPGCGFALYTKYEQCDLWNNMAHESDSRMTTVVKNSRTAKVSTTEAVAYAFMTVVR